MYLKERHFIQRKPFWCNPLKVLYKSLNTKQMTNCTHFTHKWQACPTKCLNEECLTEGEQQAVLRWPKGPLLNSHNKVHTVCASHTDSSHLKRCDPAYWRVMWNLLGGNLNILDMVISCAWICILTAQLAVCSFMVLFKKVPSNLPKPCLDLKGTARFLRSLHFSKWLVD